MAQSVSLWGANYTDVPALDVPKTGGGTARFTDVTPTTAVASDVSSGKVFFLADGTQSTGTSSGGGGGDGYVWQDQDGYVHLSDEGSEQITVEALSVTQNGTYTAPTGTAYSPVTVNVSGGGASNIVTGTFTGTTTGAPITINIQNSDNKQPIAFFIYPSEGMYNPNGTLYNTLQRYAILSFFAVRNVFPFDNTTDGTTVVRYKNSTSSATSYTQSGGTGNVPFGVSAPNAATASTVARVGISGTNTYLKVFIADTSYGFMANIEYTYYIIFSS